MSEFERKVSRNLQCPVCFELLCDPKQLSCTHTFCKKCLNDILKSSSKDNLTCPICRSVTSVEGGNVLNLNTNVPLKSLIDDVRNSQQVCEICDSNSRAIHLCCECGKNMCNTCLENHNKWPAHLKHRVVRVEDVREGRVVLEKEVYCQEHNADKQKYICTDVCVTCKKFICLRCRMLYHDKKGHTVQDAKEYNAYTKTQIESLQARGKTKVTTIKNHVTCIKTQKKRVTDHIVARKVELNKQLDAQEENLCKRLDEMQDLDERLIASIESASVLAGNSMKAPLEGDIIVIRDTLSGELKNVLDRDDPEDKMATDIANCAERLIFTPKCDQLNSSQLPKIAIGIGIVLGFVFCLIVVTCLLCTPNNDPECKLATDEADRAEQLIITPNNQSDQLNIGEVRVVKYVSVRDVELSEKGYMNVMAATPDGMMAVGYSTGGIDIFSADGQLQETVLNDVGIRDVGFLSDGQYVVLLDNNDVIMYTEESGELYVMLPTLSHDEGGFGSLTVDSNDLVYVGYRKAKKIQVFSLYGGKAINEIPCHGYTPWQITSYNDLLITKYINTVRIIDKDGNVIHKVEKSEAYSYAAVTQNNSILIAWVKLGDGLVSIDEYTSDLKHVQTLISDYKIKKPERNWYYLQEFRLGEIAFCTPDRLYIFKLTTTPVHE